MPATTPEVEPEPDESRTLTAMRVVFLATPYLVPPMVPATWVPWPLPSVLDESTWLVPQTARPPKSLWLVWMPVSMTYEQVPAPALESYL